MQILLVQMYEEKMQEMWENHNGKLKSDIVSTHFGWLMPCLLSWPVDYGI